MKAILEFNLPDDAEAHQSAVDGAKWRSLVGAVDQRLRDTLKYKQRMPASARTALEELRVWLHDELNDEHLRLEGT